MRLITSQRAKRDIEDIARYIALDSSQSAEDVRKAFNNACELLLHTPEMGSPRGFYNPALDDLRMIRLQNFKNYLIFYRPPREGKEGRSPEPPEHTGQGEPKRPLSHSG